MPTLLGAPAARLWAYPRETVVAEKCKAMVDLGLGNSRLKDFYDLRHLAAHFDFDGPLLCQALGATFGRRATALPAGTPPALTAGFYADAGRNRQWQAFWKKSAPPSVPSVSLEECVGLIRAFLLPPLWAVRDQSPFDGVWQCRSGQWEQTLAEAVREAAQDVKGESVHK